MLEIGAAPRPSAANNVRLFLTILTSHAFVQKFSNLARSSIEETQASKSFSNPSEIA